MSSSEELMQAAEPMIKNIVSSIDSNELVPQWNKSAQLDGETAIGRPSGFLPGTTIPDPRSTFRKRMDRQEFFPDSVAEAIFEQKKTQAGIERNAEGNFVNPDGTRMSEQEYFATAGVRSLEDKRDENYENIRDYGDDAMRGKSFGYPKPQEFGFGGMIGAGLNFIPKVATKVLEKGISPLVSGMQKIDKARGPGMGGMNYIKPRMKNGKIVNPGSFTRKDNDVLFPQKYVDVTEDAVKFKARMINNFGSVGLAQQNLKKFMDDLVKTDNEDTSEDKKETTKLLEDSLGKSVKELANEVGIQTPKNRSVSDITREYMRVAKNTAIADPGSFAQRFGKSILMGLTTELATKPTGGKGSGIQDREHSSDARLQLATKLISENQMTGPEAFAMADKLLQNLFPMDATAQTAAAGSKSKVTTMSAEDRIANINNARIFIQKGAPKDQVIAKLEAAGITDHGLS
jgi:hypothetical protein